jgi:lipoic acid synthetase
VLTSVDRDDSLTAAAHYAACRAIKARNPPRQSKADAGFPGVYVEMSSIRGKAFAQNVETVARLTHPVRDVRAGY